MTWSSILFKAKPVKKKRMVQVKNAFINQELGEKIDPIQRAYTKWKNDCGGLKLSDIGITGKGHKKDGSSGTESLLDFVEAHVSPQVQRPNAGPKRGVQNFIRTLDSIILDEETIIETDDEELILGFIEQLEEMSGTDTDPRNIKFTDPEDIGEVKGKKKEIGGVSVYGHYRTPMYVRARKEVHNSKNEQGAVNSSWYNRQKNQAKPPAWQAIFAGADNVENGGAGDTIKKGLLAILQEFGKALEGAYIEDLVINDKGDFANKVDSLAKLPQLLKRIKDIVLNNQSSYRGGGHQLMYGGPNGITTLLNSMKFKGQQKQTQRYLVEIAPYLKDIAGMDDVEEFSIKFTDATVNRLINMHVRGKEQKFVPTHLGTNGKPFLLSSAGGGRKVKGQPWSSGYEQALANSKITKSWHDGLWG